MAGSNIVVLPLNSPPINGFTPQVVFGMSDEFDNDDFGFQMHNADAPGSAPDGSRQWLPLNGTPAYKTAIFDTGSGAHLLTLHEQETTFNLPGAGLDGTNEVDLFGAGTESEPALVNSGAGVYVSGFGAASVSGGSTIGVAPNSFKGGYNISVLNVESDPPTSILPNIIGAPMLGSYQAIIRNSRQRSLTINGDTLTTPQVDFTTLNSGTKIPGGYSQPTVTAEPNGSFTTPASYYPDVANFDLEHITKHPSLPSQWGALMVSGVGGSQTADATHTGGSFSSAKFLFDTGAQATVLSSNTASALGFDLGGENPATPDFYVEVGGVGGVVDNAPGFYIEHLTVGSNGGTFTWNHVPIIVLDLKDPSTGGNGIVPGILGMNLFTDRDLIINGGSSAYVGIGPQFREWSATGGGSWTDATKWSTASVPNNLNTPALFRDAITTDASVTLASDVTAGSLTFDSTHSYTISGAGRITLQTSAANTIFAASAASIWVGAGSHTISTPMTFAVDTTIETDKAASMLTISNDVTATTALTKLGPGTLRMKNVRAGNLTINAGMLRVLQNGGQGGTSKVSSLTINAGNLDLVDNDLVVKNGSVSALTGLIQSGRNGGSWTGGGIVTSAANGNLTTLGIATASQVKGIASGATSTWSGQTVTGSDALVMYTYGGDANLDGKINVDDYGRIDFNVNLGTSGWYNGDFNYDGKINVDDYGIIDFNIGIQGTPLLSAGGDNSSSVSAVPEPAGLAILLAGTSLMCRRRRSNRRK